MENNHIFFIRRNEKGFMELYKFYNASEPARVYKFEEEHRALQLALIENKRMEEDKNKYMTRLNDIELENYNLRIQIEILTRQLEHMKKKKEEPLPLDLDQIFN